MPVWTHAEEVAALEQHISALRTKLALRERQLREADAELARLRADKACPDAACAEAMRILAGTPVDTAPEPWEAIVTAAIRWRRGADRGELAAAVDAFTGESATADDRWHPDPVLVRIAKAVSPGTLPMEDAIVHNINATRSYQNDTRPIIRAAFHWHDSGDVSALRAAIDTYRKNMENDPVLLAMKKASLASEPMTDDERAAIERFEASRRREEPDLLRPEQYADGAGAQAWRQAMGGKL